MASPAGSVDRIVADLAELSAISDEGHGVTRVAYSEADRRARGWFQARCEALGLEFESDRYGNCFGWPDGRGIEPLVLIGSHLDSVPGGGAYDGALGVVVGFELARWALDTSGVRVAVVSFACEESSRFGIGGVGSGLWSGRLDAGSLDRLVDADGTTLRTWLERNDLASLGSVDVFARDPIAYVEVHVDQGSGLVDSGARIGVVPTIAGIVRTRITWKGESAHSGAQTRARRRDALHAAARFVVAAQDAWRAIESTGDVVALTVGYVDVRPNSPNTVPGEVELIVDLRAAHAKVLASTQMLIEELAREAADACATDVSIGRVGDISPTRMDPAMVAQLEKTAAELGHPYVQTPSLAGHDAELVSAHIPAAMLFVANPAGVSHNPREAVDLDSLAAVVDVLERALPAFAAAAEVGVA